MLLKQPFRYVPYCELGEFPNVIVDGAPNEHTVLTLSHWPRSGTPPGLMRDTSAEIAFAYLDAPDRHSDVDVVSNNHFDEDGLVALFTLLEPDLASARRDLLVDVATTGDFGTYRSRDAARIVFTLSAHADPTLSPLPADLFQVTDHYDQGQVAGLYRNTLELFPALLQRLDDYRRYWQEEDEHLTRSEELVERGVVEIEEHPEIDLAVVRIPEDLASHRDHRFAQPVSAVCHPFAIHNRTQRNRLLLVQGQGMELQYRYESWVQFASRRPLPRVDLSDFCAQIDAEEANGRWVFDGVDEITPKLHLEHASASSIPADRFIRDLCEFLKDAPPAWDPYDRPLETLLA
jgi:hypothetical protein